MAIPLTKKKKGILYVRAPEIDAEIDEAITLDAIDLKKRLSIKTHKQPGYFRSETLIHLIRKALRENNKQVLNEVIRALFIRCERNLLSTVSNTLPNAQKIREDTLAQLGTIIAKDGTGTVPDRLDPYECTFNLSLKSLRIDAIRRETKAVKKIATLPERDKSGDISNIESEFESISNRKRSSDGNTMYEPSPEENLMAREIYRAINELPEDERKALVLVKVVGFTEIEAAKKLNVSDRTVRTRIKDAKARLASRKEHI